MNMSTKRKRSKRRYWIGLGIYTAVLLIVAVFGLTMVWQYAEEYEASRPNNTMNEYVAQLNESLWDSGISDAISTMKHEAQSDEECAAIIQDMLADGISYQRKGSGTDENEAVTVAYSLRCGDNTIGTVTLTQDESKAEESKFNMLPWTIVREEFDFTGLCSSVSVTIPETYSVELNGFKLGSKYIVEEDIHYDVLEDYYKINPELPTKVTYQYDDMIGELEPVIYDENGDEFIIDPNKDDSQFVKPCSEEDSARLETFGRDFSYNYMIFSSGTKDPTYALSLVSPYIKNGSDLDTRLRDALDGYSWSHTYSLRTDSITFNGATDLGGGCYVVDMTTVGTTLDTAHGEQTTTNNMKIIVESSSGSLQAVSIELY